MQTGSDKWLDIYLSRRTLFFILTKGRQMKSAALDREEKSLKCEEVITYFVVASVHCAGAAHDCLANNKQKQQSQLILTDGFLRLYEQFENV